MGQFRDYGRRFDEKAQAVFKEFHEVETEFKKAEQEHRAWPERHGLVELDYAVHSAQAKVDFLAAQAKYKEAKKKLMATQFKALRDELEAAIETEYAANPGQVDNNTLKLLESGILTPVDYKKLVHDAKIANNRTMLRFIGQSADKLARTLIDSGRQVDQSKAYELQVLAVQCTQEATGAHHLQNFDALNKVFDMTAANPAMAGHWEKLTGPIIEQF